MLGRLWLVRLSLMGTGFVVGSIVLLSRDDPIVPADYARAVVLGLAFVAIVLTLASAITYTARYLSASPVRRHALIAPYLVWGMGWSFILLLLQNIRRIVDRLGQEILVDVIVATGLSTVIALWWLDAVICRQMARYPEPSRAGDTR